MTRRTGLWLIAVVVALCVIVPFTFLSEVTRWYGSFLFWTVAGVAIIALNVAITRGFGSHRDE